MNCAVRLCSPLPKNHTLHGNSPRKETEAGDCSVNIGGGVLLSTWSAGIGQADTSCGNCRVLGAMAGGGVVPPPMQRRLATLRPSSGVAAGLV